MGFRVSNSVFVCANSQSHHRRVHFDGRKTKVNCFGSGWEKEHLPRAQLIVLIRARPLEAAEICFLLAFGRPLAPHFHSKSKRVRGLSACSIDSVGNVFSGKSLNSAPLTLARARGLRRNVHIGCGFRLATSVCRMLKNSIFAFPLLSLFTNTNTHAHTLA